MKLPNLKPDFIRAYLRPPLPVALAIGWWALAALFIVFLVFDGFLFFQYGLGRAEETAIAPKETGFLFRQEAVKAAAAKIRERQARFDAASSTPTDLPNPFR